MLRHLKPWHLAVIVVLLCGGALLFAHWKRGLRHFDATALIECLPPDRSTHVYLDVAALRASGILDLIAGSKALEEQDYRQFVEQTGFDYRVDLDAAAVGFVSGDTYFALRG